MLQIYGGDRRDYISMNKFNLLTHIKGLNDKATVVWIFNIGVEKYWIGDISTVKDQKEDIVVNHIEEINLLLTRKNDILILRKRPDEDYLKYMQKKGFEIPTILVPDREDEALGISELILQDKKLLKRLKDLASQNDNMYLVPYGVSELEEKISKMCQIKLVGASSDLCKAINNKIFSRSVSDELHFNKTKGSVCETYEDLREKSLLLLNEFPKIIIKQPCGASGKGLWIIDSERKLNSVLQILKRFYFGRSINQGWIIEGWYEKKQDINYQVFVHNNGEVEVFSVKEQLLDETVYIGSLMPPRVSDEIFHECIQCGKQIGEYLYQQGYCGMLGIDAIVTMDDILIPIIEINARFTLSTYISFLDSYRGDKYLLSFYKKIPITEKTNYLQIVKRLNDLDQDKNLEAFSYISETVNGQTVGQNGRLFVLNTLEMPDDVIENYQIISDLWRKREC